MRNRAVWLMLALVSVVALSGCGGENTPQPTKEEIIQQHLEGRELDPIEGVWLWDSGDYEAAIFKDTEGRHPGYEYVAVLTSTKQGNWRVGDVKVALKKTASERLYAVDYYYADKTLGGTVATLTDNTILEMNLPQVGRTVLLKVYPIKGKNDPKPARTGAGFFVEKDLVATNYHLVVDARQVSATFGNVRFGAKLLAGDRVNDLALLKVESPAGGAEENLAQTRITPLPLGEVRNVKAGDQVYAGGFSPDGDFRKGAGAFTSVVTSVAALDGDPRLLQVNLPVLPFNIGGPLMNVHGEVIGVTTSTSDNPYLGLKKEALPAGVNLVMKANYLANLLSTLPFETSPGTSPVGDELTPAQLADRLNSAMVLIEAKD